MNSMKNITLSLPKISFDHFDSIEIRLRLFYLEALIFNNFRS